MTTEAKGKGYSDARSFLEELAGGPLTLGRALCAIREGEEMSQVAMAASFMWSQKNRKTPEQLSPGRVSSGRCRCAQTCLAIGFRSLLGLPHPKVESTQTHG